MSENNYVEWCPYCEEESRIRPEMVIQTCEHCGEELKPCSICPTADEPWHNCGYCPAEIDWKRSLISYKRYVKYLERFNKPPVITDQQQG